MIQYANPGLKWQHLGADKDLRGPIVWQRVEDRMEKVLGSWLGTPYMSGQCCAGTNADCIGFAGGFLDQMRRIPPSARPKLPADTSMHDRKSALRAVRKLRQIYAPNRLIRPPCIVEPGDLIVVGTAGPGHVMVVGPQPNTLWHCNIGVGVVRTGLMIPTTHRLFGVYRVGNKETWL